MAASKLFIDTLSQIEKKNLPPRLKREFHVCDDNDKNAGPVIRVMQWNILAQALCHGSDNFVLCPKEALHWENRNLRVIEELLQYSPQVLCLQEVDKFEFVKENLGKVGYEGIFFPKPDSPCLDFEHHTGPDGCAIFYATDKIKLISQKCIVLKDNGYETNQVCVICTFGIIGNDHTPNFTVAVTHLKAKTGFEELRFSQGSYLLRYLEEKVESGPVIVCGDFNADPKEKVYAAFKASVLGLQSAYTYLSKTKSEPDYTTWKFRGSRRSPNGREESCKTIDYIWHSKHFRPKAILEIPTGEDLGENKLPSMVFPSDHLSLVCDLQLTS